MKLPTILGNDDRNDDRQINRPTDGQGGSLGNYDRYNGQTDQLEVFLPIPPFYWDIVAEIMADRPIDQEKVRQTN